MKELKCPMCNVPIVPLFTIKGRELYECPRCATMGTMELWKEYCTRKALTKILKLIEEQGYTLKPKE